MAVRLADKCQASYRPERRDPAPLSTRSLQTRIEPSPCQVRTRFHEAWHVGVCDDFRPGPATALVCWPAAGRGASNGQLAEHGRRPLALRPAKTAADNTAIATAFVSSPSYAVLSGAPSWRRAPDVIRCPCTPCTARSACCCCRGWSWRPCRRGTWRRARSTRGSPTTAPRRPRRARAARDRSRRLACRCCPHSRGEPLGEALGVADLVPLP